ncbi:hypothetical protein HER10_EVM0010450 [Colletotrichum scovillei]|uniref:uncharacterized protein n=1 Tax=Colletotrichum scovillei TaxID=1209932 RepID=UPI0015C36140|nr:uncharacterized protein HER10_EVM0010450 [Colletotrichum scovillei]KAF4780243.1 hypothetical protein HER10_EVM0010450 [Colletotrichum scovillei]KAH8422005.1 MesJ [Colletotrichum scovillei]KAH8422194.1 MesJ [Colletotrichum scovillei]KAH8422222.1 MesJ [Colletotrichum scovillei]
MVTILPSLWPCPDLKKISLPSRDNLSSWLNMPLSNYLVQASIAVLLVIFGIQMQTTAAQATPLTCTNVDQPNPIFSQYPNNATGLLNVTMVIIPIPMTTARQIIPQQYGILEGAYRALMPNFPADMYPVVVQAGHDHDIRFQDFGIPDFSKSGFEFPFLDLLGDGKSSFRWAPEQLISASNPAAVTGSQAYGTEVHAATFAPECNAYSATAGGGTSFNGTAGDKYMSLEMKKSSCGGKAPPYTLAMFDTIINQPIFANGSTCDQQIRLFNTSVTTGAFEPVPVRGTLKSNLGPFQTDASFSDVAGFQAATPFIENNYLPCEMFRGYNPVKTT